MHHQLPLGLADNIPRTLMQCPDPKLDPVPARLSSRQRNGQFEYRAQSQRVQSIKEYKTFVRYQKCFGLHQRPREVRGLHFLISCKYTRPW